MALTPIGILFVLIGRLLALIRYRFTLPESHFYQFSVLPLLIPYLGSISYWHLPKYANICLYFYPILMPVEAVTEMLLGLLF